MDFITRKFAYIYLKLTEWIVNVIVWVYAFFSKRKDKSQPVKSIGAYWYYPPDLTGSNIRLGGWKEYFERDRFTYTNLSLNMLQEYVDNVENGTWTKRYLYFAKNIWRRLPQILRAHKFDVLWIDRALIPFYPRKSAFLEKQIKKVVQKMVVDVTDGGDYQDNEKLYGAIYSAADEMTVGYKYLTEYFGNKYKLTQIFWTIPHENYIGKTNYKINGAAIIGWMGSPANFEHVLSLLPVLRELSKKYDFVLKYICRKDFSEELTGIKSEHHYFGADYYNIISSFDIGISPFLVENLRTKGKIAMKHQEFLLMGIPQVCSPVALSEFVENEKHVIIIENKDWGNALIELLSSESKREYLGMNSRELFNNYYKYEGQYSILKKVLVNIE